ncbi:hypothetical protein GS474_15915 [Rhodococcus hoagii]|nr:hypothetical protein [Prescottella equi]NKR60217.1 hypothetical protein [Prescottella equi]
MQDKNTAETVEFPEAATLSALLEQYGLSLWSSIRFSDGSSRVSVHVDDRFNPDVAELSGDIWVINAPSPTLRGAIQLAIEHVLEAAPEAGAA